MFLSQDETDGLTRVGRGVDIVSEDNTYEDPLADVFGTTDTLDHDTAPRTTGDDPSDIPRLRSTHVTNGYREGIAHGKERTIQAGFDEGYALGAEFGIVVGRLQGLLAGVVAAARKLAVSHETLAQLVGSAKQELATEKLFSPEYFDEDGIWKYAVPDTETESDVTFRKVAAAHPIVVKWLAIVRETVQSHKLDLDHKIG